MDYRFTYILGTPGTDIPAALNNAYHGYQRRSHIGPIPYTRLVLPANNDVYALALGASKKHPGTDGLPRNIGTPLTQWLRNLPHENIHAHGDRLATPEFAQTVVNAGYALQYVILRGEHPAAGLPERYAPLLDKYETVELNPSTKTVNALPGLLGLDL